MDTSKKSVSPTPLTGTWPDRIGNKTNLDLAYPWDMSRSPTLSSSGFLQSIFLNLRKKIFYFHFCSCFLAAIWPQKNNPFIRDIPIYVYYELLKIILRNPSGRAAAMPCDQLPPPSRSGRHLGFFSSSMSRHDLKVALLCMWCCSEVLSSLYHIELEYWVYFDVNIYTYE